MHPESTPPFVSELAELKTISARLGADPEQIQAGGGNTSLKDGDRLIVKASGKWLAKALVEEVFVSASLSEIRRSLQTDKPSDEAFKPTTSDLQDQPSTLRPSIETAFHALLEDRVVLHTHSTATIAYAVLANGPAYAADVLAGLQWAWVPYVKPGVGLALEVARIAREKKAAVIVLANHGLIVTGATVREAADLLQNVEARMHRESAADSAAPGIATLMKLAADLGGGYEPATDRSWHALGTNPHAYQAVTGGSLYPDHVVFLGPAVWAVSGVKNSSGAPRNASDLANPDVKPVIIVENAGCLMRRDLGEAPRALLSCLASVARKTPVGEQIQYLTLDDEAALLHWDAEHYRQKLGRS